MTHVATIDWPLTLPQAALADRYSYSQDTDIIRTEMDSGRARQRKTFRSTPIHIDAAWLMTTAQLDIFRSWLEFEASFGASYFNVPLLLEGTTLISTVARFSADRDITYECLTGDDALENLWRVTATLEITP